MIVDKENAFPCRVNLRDAEIGEEMILCNFEHLSVRSPYRARHAVFVSKGAETKMLQVDELPEHLASRLLSLRGFTKDGMMRKAEVVEGDQLRAGLNTILQEDGVEFVDIHNARQGCFHARAVKA